MANLNEKQKRLLENVRETYEQIRPQLTRLEEDYLFADFRAKAPVRDAIAAAEEAGVPLKRITEEGMGFTYPAKLRAWMQAPDAVVRRLMSGNVVEAASAAFEEVVDTIRTVTRDNTTGVFTVVYLGEEYNVPSFGPTDESWSTADPSVPQGVYDLIQSEYPTWVLLEADD